MNVKTQMAKKRRLVRQLDIHKRVTEIAEQELLLHDEKIELLRELQLLQMARLPKPEGIKQVMEMEHKMKQQASTS